MAQALLISAPPTLSLLPSWLSQAPASSVPHTLPPRHYPHCHQDEETEEPPGALGREPQRRGPPPTGQCRRHAAGPLPAGGPKGVTSEVPLEEGTQVCPSPVERACILSSLLRESWGEGELLHSKISVVVGVVRTSRQHHAVSIQDSDAEE